MGSKLSLEQYLEKVPESFRSGFELLELFNGNRTNIAFTFSSVALVSARILALTRSVSICSWSGTFVLR